MPSSRHDATEKEDIDTKHIIAATIILIATPDFPLMSLLSFCRRNFAPQAQLAGVHWTLFLPAPFFLALAEG